MVSLSDIEDPETTPEETVPEHEQPHQLHVLQIIIALDPAADFRGFPFKRIKE